MADDLVLTLKGVSADSQAARPVLTHLDPRRGKEKKALSPKGRIEQMIVLSCGHYIIRLCKCQYKILRYHLVQKYYSDGGLTSY